MAAPLSTGLDAISQDSRSQKKIVESIDYWPLNATTTYCAAIELILSHRASRALEHQGIAEALDSWI